MTPMVSVITTVYDRVPCLERCLRAMQHSHYPDWEQIVVADAPGSVHVEAIRAAAAARQDPRVRVLVLEQRAKDWGMTPAYAGLQVAKGRYVAFLSDDNAYLPDHLAPLVACLEGDPTLGFAYSSCQYAGRRVLDVAPPKGANIDLGQPLFRRAILLAEFPDRFPFHEHAWDWRLIHQLVTHGVRWHHHPAPTFIFKLEKYPQHLRALA